MPIVVYLLRCTYCGNDRAEWRGMVVIENGVLRMRLMCVQCGGVLIFRMHQNAVKYLRDEGAIHDEKQPCNRV